MIVTSLQRDMTRGYQILGNN